MSICEQCEFSQLHFILILPVLFAILESIKEYHKEVKPQAKESAPSPNFEGTLAQLEGWAEVI